MIPQRFHNMRDRSVRRGEFHTLARIYAEQAFREGRDAWERGNIPMMHAKLLQEKYWERRHSHAPIEITCADDAVRKFIGGDKKSAVERERAAR